MRFKRIFSFFSLLLIVIFAQPVTGKDVVYFSPDDHPSEKLIDLINHAHHKIYAAVYMITDRNIAEALTNAKKRGVDVKVIMDRASFEGSWGKGKYLKENNIELFVFGLGSKPKTKFPSALMHNKFALIDNQLWNGSFNWTRNANKNNQENVILTDNSALYTRFQKHFEVLKVRSQSVAQKYTARNAQTDNTLWNRTRTFFQSFKESLRIKL
ncbi:MAG: phospholipase D-like domain-containing protein [Candidatus Babeliales bacterium]|jgi:phosphatidylserine/phosphatidylglycerophosphate/cardiolipin synthase-like enzyme